VLESVFAEQCERGAVETVFSTAVTGLVTEGKRVTGVELDGEYTVAGSAVVLTTGGYAANAELFAEFDGYPLVSAAAETSTGDGLRLARSVGAAVAGRGEWLPTFGGLPHPDDASRVLWEDRPLLVAAERTPCELYVGRDGQRFVAEDEDSIDAKERVLLERVDDLTFLQIFDDRAVDESQPIVAGWEPDDLRAAAGQRLGVHQADTLQSLAVSAGIDPARLERTIFAYNTAVRRGWGDEQGRHALPAPIEQPPPFVRCATTASRSSPSRALTSTGAACAELGWRGHRRALRRWRGARRGSHLRQRLLQRHGHHARVDVWPPARPATRWRVTHGSPSLHPLSVPRSLLRPQTFPDNFAPERTAWALRQARY
jgi:hypothetical protein